MASVVVNLPMNEVNLTEKTIYFEAAGIADLDRRSAYLDVVCKGNDELRNRVQSLLDARAAAGGFLDSPPVESAIGSGPADNNKNVAPFADKRIGPYKLLEKIGEGGFGEVYMAEQTRPFERRVAIKIIKPGMDSKQVIARFEAERQALALMNHPNIANIYDAGQTETGRPFFAMELVRGVPIITYCDERGLSTRQRLELFKAVCSAIQHAHQKGIIHRDIKPSNILVATNGDRPQPKVIDFGIAKATQGRLTEKTLFTHFQQFIGTPAYMSPEQAQMSAVDVDTRSDIYSLGVLLYELLTGMTPFNTSELRKAGFQEMCRRIREDVAPKPSRRLSSLSLEEVKTQAQNRGTEPKDLIDAVSNELDWVVMKAIEKTRSRRYATAETFLDDIQRYLNGEPVSAVPRTGWYVLKKAVNRHRTLVATAAAIASTLVVATLVSGWLALRLSAELGEKEQAIRQVEQSRDHVELERSRAERLAYASDMNNASQALMSLNVGLARSYIERQAATGNKDLRHWEWPVLSKLVRGSATFSFSTQSDIITRICLGRDGTWIATGSERGNVRIWNARSGELLRTLVDSRTGEEAHGLVMTESGDRLCAMTPDGQFISWSLPTFEVRRRQFELSGTMERFALSHNQSLLAIGDNNSVTLWRLAEDDPTTQVGRSERQPTDAGSFNLVFSPDDQLLAIGSHSQIRIVDTNKMTAVATLPHGGAYDMEFSPDGQLLASSPRFITLIIDVYRVSDWKHLGKLEGHSGMIWDVAFSPDNKWLASASADTTVRIWNLATMSLERVLTGNANEVWSIEFTRDGKQLVSGGKGDVCYFDDVLNVDSSWPVIAREAVPDHWHRMYSQAGFSRDSKWLATRNHDSTVSLRDPITLREAKQLTILGQNVRGVLFSPKEDMLAAGHLDGHLSIVNMPGTNEPLAADVTRVKLVDTGQVSPIRFSADGKRLLVIVQPDGDLETVKGDATYFVWSVEQKRVVHSWTIPGMDKCADMSPDGGTVVTGHNDGRVRFWNVESSNQSSDVEIGMPVFSIAFSPDGRRVAIGNTAVHLFDMETRKVIVSMSLNSTVHSIAFSRDGRRIATGSGSDSALNVWDVETSQQLLTLGIPGNYYSCRQVEFSPDQHSIMLIGGFGHLAIWHVDAH